MSPDLGGELSGHFEDARRVALLNKLNPKLEGPLAEVDAIRWRRGARTAGESAKGRPWQSAGCW
ncbi:hypothetical protein [Acidisoma sp. L85]|uniref:hypothetical protein n=1 Tax=Acidisoma sp. L85 TaxID=1641850 RepID=UPI00131ACE1A|nr:hypothetical protein [Acidisoma sp. L85]